MKKVLALLLALILGVSVMSSCTASKKLDNEGDGEKDIVYEPDDLTVLTDYVDFVVDIPEGRDIRVLQLTDVQTVSGDLRRYPNRISESSSADIYNGYKKYIGQVIERYKPDFIFLTGDNVYGEFDDGGKYFLELVNFMDSFKIPWAPVLGNHDAETNMGVDWLCEQFENSDYCLFKQRELTGNGNYTVALTQGGRVKRVFYMLDSNGGGNMSALSFSNGHSKRDVGFGDDQIEWYTESMTKLKKQYPNVKLSAAFHIQLSVFWSAIKTYGTVSDIPIDLSNNKDAIAAGDFGYVGSEMKSAWDGSKEVFNGLRKLGVDSIFVGHEHRNSVSVSYRGVRLTYGQKSSTFDRYNTDKNGPVMGGTYILLSPKDGKISDAGLCLYDHELGYDLPTVDSFDPDDLPEDMTSTVLDLDGIDIDPTVTNKSIGAPSVLDVTASGATPIGFDGKVYGGGSTDASAIGIKFGKPINVDRLVGIYVKMYVSSYTVTAGSVPLLRIYDGEVGSCLNEIGFTNLGGKNDEWVYVNILDLIKGANGIVHNGSIDPFTLVYRFYGKSIGRIYFDSVTVVSNGDPYEFDEASRDDSICAVRGEEYKVFTAKDLSGVISSLKKSGKAFYAIASDSYSVKFKLTPNSTVDGLAVSGYVSGSDDSNAISVTFNGGKVSISKYTTNLSFNAGQAYDIEVGFVSLYNGNTVYVFVNVNGETVAWELVEAYGRTVGNLLITANDLTQFDIK